eukprot:CAMPEP_0197734772 /NCGR_PEP_ID=MMETSP1434-20131217/44594_1 /TAXON_ID=265543 /ORGANISM="Minutocellus polymorphus, Strain CCMP3303" /LENGTH=38 /DNA_ID= /DNA_START= /DNA_END= /DNA_ORIENTATION=
MMVPIFEKIQRSRFDINMNTEGSLPTVDRKESEGERTQ